MFFGRRSRQPNSCLTIEEHYRQSFYTRNLDKLSYPLEVITLVNRGFTTIKELKESLDMVDVYDLLDLVEDISYLEKVEQDVQKISQSVNK